MERALRTCESSLCRVIHAINLKISATLGPRTPRRRQKSSCSSEIVHAAYSMTYNVLTVIALVIVLNGITRLRLSSLEPPLKRSVKKYKYFEGQCDTSQPRPPQAQVTRVRISRLFLKVPSDENIILMVPIILYVRYIYAGSFTDISCRATRRIWNKIRYFLTFATYSSFTNGAPLHFSSMLESCRFPFVPIDGYAWRLIAVNINMLDLR